MLKIATLFSGIGSFEHSLQRMKIPHKIIFACDSDKYVKKSYFANYEIADYVLSKFLEIELKQIDLITDIIAENFYLLLQNQTNDFFNKINLFAKK